MINILSIFSWSTWFIIVLIIFFLFWVVFGGRQEYEFIGVKPLTTPKLFETPINYINPVDTLIQIPTKNEPIINLPKSSKGEDMVYEILTKLLESPIVRNARPDFLKNPETGSNLEIDCYCEEYAIAVEYNGIQHYKYPSAFHSSEKQFYDQVYRDRLKKKLCDQSGVYLIVVPYWVDMYDDPNEHIKEKNQQFKRKFVSRDTRYMRLYEYLYAKISEYFEIIFPQYQNDIETENSFDRRIEYDLF